MKKRILSALLVAAVAFGTPGIMHVAASTISNAENKKNEAQSNLDDVNQSISNIESEQSQLQSEIDKVDAELVQLLVDMDILEGELTAKDEQLEQVKADLVVAQEKEDSQYDAMTKRIQFMYETNDTSFLTAILEAESLAEVLNRIHYYANVYDYDRDLLTQLQETKQQVADLKVQVEQEKAELEEMQVAYEEQEQELNAVIDRKRGEMADFDTQLASAQELAAKYKATIEEQNEIIRAEQERQAAEEAARKAAEEAAQKAAEEAAAQQAAQQAAQAAATQQAADSGSTQEDSGSASGDSQTASDSGASSGSDSAASSSDTGKNPSYSTGVSGSSVVSYACQFIGNSYVWGGTDPNTGADCSGFTQYVYAHFGISLPRTSGAQRSAGQEVSYANAQPGDLICYSGHVAIYMGGGQIVHAANSATGITTGSATYRTILSVRRVL